MSEHLVPKQSEEDIELLSQIFKRREKETKVGRAIPSPELIAQYWREIDIMQAARARTEHSITDKLIVS